MPDSDYLINEPDKVVLGNLADMGAHLKDLKTKMVMAEELFKAAQKEYEYYANSVLPMEMYNLGVSRFDLMDGGSLLYERHYYCKPNKNEEDKKIIADWLRKHGGAHLIKQRAAVDAAKIEELKKTGIPFTEICDFNTNSLKAFTKSLLGDENTPATIQLEDVPAAMHFQEFATVNVEL